MSFSLRIQSKPIRKVLMWQLAVTAALAVLAGLLAGLPAAKSVCLGGFISIASGIAFGLMASRQAPSAGTAIRNMLRAESVKIGVVVILFWLVLKAVSNIVPLALLGSFIVSTLIQSMAFFVRDSSYDDATAKSLEASLKNGTD